MSNRASQRASNSSIVNVLRKGGTTLRIRGAGPLEDSEWQAIMEHSAWLKVQTLIIEGVEITKAGLDAIVRLLLNGRGPQVLRLQDNRLGDQFCTAIVEALRNNSFLETLVLRDNKIGDNAVLAFAKILPTLLKLSVLDLQHNWIGDDSIVALSQAMSQVDSITNICYRDNRISSRGADAIAAYLKQSKSIRVFDIRENKLGNSGAKSFAQVLSTNKSLQILNLSDNQISDEGALPIGAALVNNRSLEMLHLRMNQIADAGGSAIARSLKSNTILTCIDFRDNWLADEAAGVFGEVLPHSKLTKLDLRENRITRQGLGTLRTALASDQHLQMIDLRDNFTNRGQPFQKENPHTTDYFRYPLKFQRQLEKLPSSLSDDFIEDIVEEGQNRQEEFRRKSVVVLGLKNELRSSLTKALFGVQLAPEYTACVSISDVFYDRYTIRVHDFVDDERYFLHQRALLPRPSIVFYALSFAEFVEKDSVAQKALLQHLDSWLRLIHQLSPKSQVAIVAVYTQPVPDAVLANTNAALASILSDQKFKTTFHAVNPNDVETLQDVIKVMGTGMDATASDRKKELLSFFSSMIDRKRLLVQISQPPLDLMAHLRGVGLIMDFPEVPRLANWVVVDVAAYTHALGCLCFGVDALRRKIRQPSNATDERSKQFLATVVASLTDHEKKKRFDTIVQCLAPSAKPIPFPLSLFSLVWNTLGVPQDIQTVCLKLWCNLRMAFVIDEGELFAPKPAYAVEKNNLFVPFLHTIDPIPADAGPQLLLTAVLADGKANYVSKSHFHYLLITMLHEIADLEEEICISLSEGLFTVKDGLTVKLSHPPLRKYIVVQLVLDKNANAKRAQISYHALQSAASAVFSFHQLGFAKLAPVCACKQTGELHASNVSNQNFYPPSKLACPLSNPLVPASVQQIEWWWLQDVPIAADISDLIERLTSANAVKQVPTLTIACAARMTEGVINPDVGLAFALKKFSPTFVWPETATDSLHQFLVLVKDNVNLRKIFINVCFMEDVDILDD